MIRTYPQNVTLDARRVFNLIYDELDRLSASRNGSGVPESQLAVVRQAAVEASRTEAARLIGAFGQPLVGETSVDPFVTPVGTGDGTVTNVTRVNNANFLTVSISSPTTAPVLTFDPNPATGWGTPSSTLARTTFATYAGQTISVLYTQAEVQAIDDHLKVVSQRLGAVITDLIAKEIFSA